MADADALLKAGDIEGARAELVARVKAQPADAATRMFLFQLLAVAGEWEKARGQLQALARLSPEAQMLAVAYGQAIDAEIRRAAAFAGTAEVPVHIRAGDWIDGVAQALSRAAAGDATAADDLRAAAFDAAPDTPGTLDGQDFDWVADADPRFGPALEAIVAGRWGLIPFDAVESIKSIGARDLRDIVWYPVEIAFRAGHSIAAMLPARYPGSEAAGDVRERMASTTAWSGDGGNGSGQRLLVLSGGEEVGLLSLRLLTFGGAA